MLRVLHQSDATDLVTGAFLGEGNNEVLHALIAVLHAVVREDQAHCDLAASCDLAGSSTGLGVLQDICVHLLHVVEAGVFTTAKNNLGPQCRERSSRGRGVCR